MKTITRLAMLVLLVSGCQQSNDSEGSSPAGETAQSVAAEWCRLSQAGDVAAYERFVMDINDRYGNDQKFLAEVGKILESCN